MIACGKCGSVYYKTTSDSCPVCKLRDDTERLVDAVDVFAKQINIAAEKGSGFVAKLPVEGGATDSDTGSESDA